MEKRKLYRRTEGQCEVVSGSCVLGALELEAEQAANCKVAVVKLAAEPALVLAEVEEEITRVEDEPGRHLPNGRILTAGHLLLSGGISVGLLAVGHLGVLRGGESDETDPENYRNKRSPYSHPRSPHLSPHVHAVCTVAHRTVTRRVVAASARQSHLPGTHFTYHPPVGQASKSPEACMSEVRPSFRTERTANSYSPCGRSFEVMV